MDVSFGKYPLKIKKEDSTTKIFDIVRKKWFVLTPEEQVRQLWLHYLISDIGFSPSNIAVEKLLKINERNKRFDICIFNQDVIPEILIECKSPNIPLNKPVLEQLSIYNSHLKANKFIISNGLQHIGYQIIENEIVPLLKIVK